MPNPFGKSRKTGNPYAIYRAGNTTMHVLKTYKKPLNEIKDPHARWLVAAKSDATFGAFELGDTYRQEVVGFLNLVAADPLWQETYGTRPLPTPAEYLADF